MWFLFCATVVFLVVVLVANSAELPFRAGAFDALKNSEFDRSLCVVLQHTTKFVVVVQADFISGAKSSSPSLTRMRVQVAWWW